MSLIYTILRWIAHNSLSYMYNYLDKNKDGTLSKTEINNTLKELKSFLSKFKQN